MGVIGLLYGKIDFAIFRRDQCQIVLGPADHYESYRAIPLTRWLR